METLTLHCWVYGQGVERIFSVDISSTKTVSALREAIKDKKPVDFRDIDADALALYSLPIDDDDHLEDELSQWSPRDQTKLNGRTRLSKLFSDPDKGEWLIVVSAPGFATPTVAPAVVVPEITFNCWVRGQPLDSVFPVDISSTKTVGHLKIAIKKQKATHLRDIDADNLALYKVSFVYDEDLEEKLNVLFGSEALLRPLGKLSDLFSDNPPQNHVHIVVQVPPSSEFRSRLPVTSLPTPSRFFSSSRSRMHPLSSFSSLLLHNVEAQRLTFIRNSPLEAPSSGGKIKSFSKRQDKPEQTIYCNRPHAALATIPPTLLHPAFGQFLDDCETHEITEHDNSLAMELNTRMSNFNSDEWTRAQAICEVFSEWGLHFVISKTNRGYVTDGDMSMDSYRYAIAEFKNEVGNTGAEPYNQAILYYLESTKKFAAMMGKSPLPCVIILLFGPYIAFAGATWNLRPVVQTLSFVLPLHYHSTDTKMRTHVARHLGAFKKVVRTLEEYYRGLTGVRLLSSQEHSQLFPYRTHFASLQDNHGHGFKYLSQPFQDKLLFFGALSDGQPICIKFVRQYSMEAHLACASLGYAPKLRGFEEIPGGWFMVVMDRVLSEEYLEFYNTTPTASLTSNIRNTLKRLHQSGLVHGDVRDTNILVSRSDETKFMFVDFDWAGKIGQVRYPMNVTRTENLWRPSGAVDGALITTEHDMDMLDEIERRYRTKN